METVKEGQHGRLRQVSEKKARCESNQYPFIKEDYSDRTTERVSGRVAFKGGDYTHAQQ